MILGERKVLLFGFGGLAGAATAEALQKRLKEKGISVYRIDKKDYRVPLGILASLSGTGRPVCETASQISGLGKIREYTGEEPEDRILLFVGFSGDDLDEALLICRECNIGKDDLKAVLTPDNALWDVFFLDRELKEEHRMMNS